MDTPHIDLTGARILIVDDTPENLRILRQALEPEGYKILVATSGEGALKVAGQVPLDLILLDVQMPGIDGFETCRRLKSNPDARHIPVIFVTARTETASVLEGFQAGGVDYIVKPFQNEEVLARVHTHLKIDHLARELAASNREIRLQTERKSRFLASMSHELRTPMNAIIGFSGIMLRQIGDDLSDRHRSNLERIGKSGHHLLKLINDILDLSKIEAGHIDVAPEPVSLQALLNDCCTTLSPLVKPGVRLDSEVDPEANETITDPGLLRQIVTNLLSNALKFTESGEVTVRATADGEDRILVVSDTGTGIPSEALDAIFEEFHQVEGTSAPLKGTGLGLAITQRLTQRLGGTIQVQSQLGQGSTFTVRLPSVCASTEQETISTP